LQDDDPRVTRRIRVLFRPSRRGQTRARRADPPEPPRPTAIAALDIVVAPLPDDVYDDRLILGGSGGSARRARVCPLRLGRKSTRIRRVTRGSSSCNLTLKRV